MSHAYELVLFDYDGTLADSANGIVSALQQTFQDFDRPAPAAEEITRRIGAPLADTIRDFAGVRQEEVPDWLVRYRTHIVDADKTSTRLYPHVEEVLQNMHDKGLALGVTSNKARAFLMGSMERLGLSKFFSVVVGTTPDSVKKPDPSFYTDYVFPHYSDTPAQKILVVGDAWPDMAFARNIGAHACYAAYGYGESESCLAYEPAHSIACFSALNDILS